MYDANPHLSSKTSKEVDYLQGGAHQSSTDASYAISTRVHRVQSALGCVIISILAMYAASSQRGATSVGLVLISLMSAMATLFLGVCLYNEPVDPQKTADARCLAGFFVLTASILLCLNARSIFALAYS